MEHLIQYCPLLFPVDVNLVFLVIQSDFEEQPVSFTNSSSTPTPPLPTAHEGLRSATSDQRPKCLLLLMDGVVPGILPVPSHFISFGFFI